MLQSTRVHRIVGLVVSRLVGQVASRHVHDIVNRPLEGVLLLLAHVLPVLAVMNVLQGHVVSVVCSHQVGGAGVGLIRHATLADCVAAHGLLRGLVRRAECLLLVRALLGQVGGTGAALVLVAAILVRHRGVHSVQIGVGVLQRRLLSLKLATGVRLVLLDRHAVFEVLVRALSIQFHTLCLVLGIHLLEHGGVNLGQGTIQTCADLGVLASSGSDSLHQV